MIKLDYLFIGAHPDDCEIMAGGTLLSLISQKRRVGILDLSRGELGSNGSAVIRKKEVARVAQIAKLSYRNCLGIKDGAIGCHIQDEIKLVKEIRKVCPEIIFTFKKDNRHPDHEATHALVRRAAFLSGLRKFHLPSSKNFFRPSAIIYFGEPYYFQDQPDFLIDVSLFYQKKIEMIKCYSSQVQTEKNQTTVKTLLGSDMFWNALQGKEKWYGSLIGCEYAEGFWSDVRPQLQDPVLNFKKKIS